MGTLHLGHFAAWALCSQGTLQLGHFPTWALCSLGSLRCVGTLRHMGTLQRGPSVVPGHFATWGTSQLGHFVAWALCSLGTVLRPYFTAQLLCILCWYPMVSSTSGSLQGHFELDLCGPKLGRRALSTDRVVAMASYLRRMGSAMVPFPTSFQAGSAVQSHWKGRGAIGFE